MQDNCLVQNQHTLITTSMSWTSRNENERRLTMT